MLHMGKHSRSSFSLWKKKLIAGTFLFLFFSTALRHARITRGTALMEALLYVAFSSNVVSLLPCRRADLSYLVKVRTNRIFSPHVNHRCSSFVFFVCVHVFHFIIKVPFFSLPKKKRKKKQNLSAVFIGLWLLRVSSNVVCVLYNIFKLFFSHALSCLAFLYGGYCCTRVHSTDSFHRGVSTETLGFGDGVWYIMPRCSLYVFSIALYLF
uniref:Putative conserved secreted protein n=1 Tax=Ixodes ricinus TaxID=34613 RepID=A0A6B0V326_IXORI